MGNARGHNSVSISQLSLFNSIQNTLNFYWDHYNGWWNHNEITQELNQSHMSRRKEHKKNCWSLWILKSSGKKVVWAWTQTRVHWIFVEFNWIWSIVVSIFMAKLLYWIEFRFVCASNWKLFIGTNWICELNYILVRWPLKEFCIHLNARTNTVEENCMMWKTNTIGFQLM